MSCLSISPNIAKTARPGAGRWLVLSLCLGLWLPVAPGALADTVPNLLPCRFPVAVPGEGSGQPADIFVCELATGATAVVADPADGNPPASFSDDGRYTAYSSADDWLVPDDHNGVADVFVADTQTGAIRRASVASDGTEADGASTVPGLAGSGGFVAFRSAASNLVQGDKNGVSDLFVHDLASGATLRLGSGLGRVPSGRSGFWPAYSVDGRYLAVRRDRVAGLRAAYGENPASGDAPVPAASALLSAAATGSANLKLTSFSMVPYPSAPARVGQDLDYRFTLANLGPDQADNVKLTIQVGSVPVTGLPQNCLKNASNQVVCDEGSLPANQPIEGYITVRPTGTGSLSASASLAADQADPTPGNNTKNASIVVQAARADVSVTLTAIPATVVVGDLVRYGFAFANAGPSRANNVMLTLDFHGAVGDVGVPTGCARAGAKLTCGPFNLDSGSNSTGWSVDARTTAPGTLTVRASVAATETDPVPANNAATVTTTVNPLSADLAVTLTPQVATARVGDTVRYDFTAMNSGSAAANNVVLTMDLGTLANVSIPPECTQQNGQMRCVFPYLPASTTPPIASYILGRITTAGPQAVSISIKAQETDPNPANNTAAPKLAAGPASADLKLTFTASPNPAKVGDQVSFLATLINNGPSPATNVVFTLDPKTVLGLQPSAACALNGDRLECQWPRLEVGQPLAGTFVGRASVAGTLEATASIRAAEAAPVTAVAVATGQGAAFVPGNIAITQKAATKKPKVGKKLTITLIARNKDAVQANNVVAMSILPPEVSYVAVGPGCSYAPQDRAMLCAFGSLRKGQSRQAKFKITPKQPGPFVNRVYVGGDLVDSSPGDNANSLRFVAK